MDEIITKLSEIENKIKQYYIIKNSKITIQINPLFNNDNLYTLNLENNTDINEIHKLHEELLIKYIIKYYNIEKQ